MKSIGILLLSSLLALPALAQDAPAPQKAEKKAESVKTEPAKGSEMSALELRANAAFEKGDFATALPLYVQASKVVTDPVRLGAIQERIRVCTKKLEPLFAAQAQAAGSVETSAEKRKPHVKPKDEGVYDVTIPALGNFEYDGEKGGNIPEDVKKLHGAKVRTRGYMIPLDQADNIREFALVADLFACCFGQPPQVQHTIVVHAPQGKAVSYFPDEIIVEGTLKVDEKKEDGIIISVFEIDCTSVKPAAK